MAVINTTLLNETMSRNWCTIHIAQSTVMNT